MLLTRGLPEQPSDDSQRGDRIHEIARGMLSAEPYAAGAYPAEIDHAIRYVTYVRELMASCPKVNQLTIEERLSLNANLGMFGTVDVAWWSYSRAGDRVAYVIDLKTGFRVKAAINNPQLAYYAAIYDLHYGPFDRFVVSIYQEARDGDPVDAWHLTRGELAVFTKRLTDGARVVRQMEAEEIAPTFKAGDWCLYCKARGPRCVTYMAHVEESSGIDLKDGRSTELVVLSRAPATFTDEQLARIVLNRELIDKWLDSIEAHAVECGLSGAPLPGTKIVRTSGRRMWADEKLVVEGLREMDVEPYRNTLRTIDSVEKEAGKGAIDHLLTRSKTSLKCVAVHDKRRAITTAASDFDAKLEDGTGEV